MNWKKIPLLIKQTIHEKYNNTKDKVVESYHAIQLELLNYIGFGVIVISLIAIFILSLVLNKVASHVPDQHLAEQWSEDDDFTQVSLFFPYGTTLDEQMLKSKEYYISASINDLAIETENESQRLFVYSYLERGSVIATKDNNTEELTAYGIEGDYFMFHPHKFISGGPILSDNINDDLVVIDEMTAWNLFGAYDVEGLVIHINGIPHIISGVVEMPDDKLSKLGGLQQNIIFMSHNDLAANGTVETAISYELLVTEQYGGFGLEMLKYHFSEYKDTGVYVDNSKRYGYRNLYEVFKNRKNRTMQTMPVIYPYWENIARYKEMTCMRLALVQLILVVLTFLTVCYEIASIYIMIASHFYKKRLAKIRA